jgi:hypothetical protein
MIYRVHKLSFGGYVLVIVFSSLQDGIDSVLFQYILTLFMLQPITTKIYGSFRIFCFIVF